MKIYKVLAIALIVVALPSLGLAHEDTTTDTAAALRHTAEEMKREAAKTRLADVKLKVCQSRETAIKARSERTTLFAEKMHDKLTTIATKVKNIYVSQIVANGRSIENYSVLVADIDVKSAAVTSAIDAGQNSGNNFSCTSENPKEQLESFRADMQAVKAALKQYRGSIKTLITTVRGSLQTPTASPSTGVTNE